VILPRRDRVFVVAIWELIELLRRDDDVLDWVSEKTKKKTKKWISRVFTHLKLIEKEKFSQIKINFISFFPYLPFLNDQNNKKKETCPCLLLYRTTLYIFILLRYFLIQISEGGRRKYFLIAISCLDSFPKFFILTFFRNHIRFYSKRKKNVEIQRLFYIIRIRYHCIKITFIFEHILVHLSCLSSILLIKYCLNKKRNENDWYVYIHTWLLCIVGTYIV
jgi:hypothetical protein